MKALLFVALLLSAGAAAPALGAPAPRPGRVLAPRPLLRFLIATLHLPDQQALMVQQVLKTHLLTTPAPDELAELLRPVLTDAQFTKFETLEYSDALGPNVRYLASLR